MSTEVWVRFGRMDNVQFLVHEISEKAIIDAFRVRFEVRQDLELTIPVFNDGLGTEDNPFILFSSSDYCKIDFQDPKTRQQKQSYGGRSFFNPSVPVPEPFDKAFSLNGIFCPSMHFVTECFLKEKRLKIDIADERVSMKNMNFAGSTVEDDPEGFQRVILSSDPFFKSMENVILLPYLEDGKSIVEVIRNFASSSSEPGYLLISGEPYTGKTLLCQSIVPMIMSTESSLKNGLYIYNDFSLLTLDSLAKFCSRWIKSLETDFWMYLGYLNISDITERGEETKLERLLTTGLDRALRIIKTLSNKFGLVLALENMHLLFKYIAEDPFGIKHFLEDLIDFTSEGTLKLVFTMDETILQFFNITNCNGIIKLPEKCTRIDLPSEHNAGLLNAADDLIKIMGRQVFPRESLDKAPVIRTAYAKCLQSKYSSAAEGADSIRSIAVNEYYSSTGWHLQELYCSDKEIHNEIVEIAKKPKVLARIEDLRLAGTRLSFFLNLMNVERIDESSLSVSFKSSYVSQLIIQHAIDHCPQPPSYGVQKVPFYIFPLKIRLKVSQCLYEFSEKEPDKVALISEFLGPHCKKYQFDSEKAALRLINTEYNRQTRRRGLSKIGINCASDQVCPLMTMEQMYEAFRGFTPDYLCLWFNRNCSLTGLISSEKYRLVEETMIPVVEKIPAIIDDHELNFLTNLSTYTYFSDTLVPNLQL